MMRLSDYKTPLQVVMEANHKLFLRVQLAEKLLKPLSVLDLCGSRTMDYEAVKALVEEFWDEPENRA